MSKDVKGIKRENWNSDFTLIGVPKLSDYTFKINEKSEKSSWIYNSLNLGIDCGERCGTVYAEMMGGYDGEKSSVIYAHGKDENGLDDFAEQIQVDWEDRFDESILESIGDLCFITVGIEKDNKGKTFYKKFLSAYDAIAYVKEHITEDMVLNVKGSLKYSTYQDNVQVRKVINSIALSKAEPDKYGARFRQTILLDKDSVNLKNLDKEKGILPVYARVLDYVKEINGVEIKGQYPFNKTFEFEMDATKEELNNKIYNKLFKVKKNITQITFEGELIEGGATVTATLDDIPQDIKDLIDIGVFTEEEALVKCSENGNREKRMVIIKPTTKRVGEEDKRTTVVQIIPDAYTEDDLVVNVPNSNTNNDTSTEIDSNTNNAETTGGTEDMDWLNQL